MRSGRFRRFLYLNLLLPTIAFGADELRIAVAANFVDTLNTLISAWHQTEGPKVIVSSGSTGKLYAQIVNGAPYDLFLAADEQRPELLAAAGIGVAGSRFSYASGRLVLWSPTRNTINAVIGNQPPYFDLDKTRFVAVANPQLAPYGQAAKQVLESLGLWEKLRGKLVRGENVNQAFHFVQTGNAEVGMIALSQLIRTQQLGSGSHWMIPAHMYDPIIQQAIIIADRPAAHDFARFMKGETAKSIIKKQGYNVPE